MQAATDVPLLSAAQRELAARIDALLPQTQCTKCGYPGCRPYAEAIAGGRAEINQCPPGGAAGIARLAALTGGPARPLNPEHGAEAPLRLAWIDEALCIGCTLCIQACPVDAIVGAPRRMHSVLVPLCTGCDLCLPPCPVDCIEMRPSLPERNWSDDDARAARERYDARRRRLLRERVAIEDRRVAKALAKLDEIGTRDDPAAGAISEIRARVAAALERARQRRQQHAEALAAADRARPRERQ